MGGSIRDGVPGGAPGDRHRGAGAAGAAFGDGGDQGDEGEGEEGDQGARAGWQTEGHRVSPVLQRGQK